MADYTDEFNGNFSMFWYVLTMQLTIEFMEGLCVCVCVANAHSASIATEQTENPDNPLVWISVRNILLASSVLKINHPTASQQWKRIH